MTTYHYPPAQPAQPAPKKTGKNVVVIGAVAVGVIGALGVTGLIAAQLISGAADLVAEDTVTTTGTVNLQNDPTSYYNVFSTINGGRNCYGSSGIFTVAQAGTDITIRNAEGTVVANDKLSSGVVSGSVCTFTFPVDAIPLSDFYTVEIGNPNDPVTFTLEEMKAGPAIGNQ